MASIEGKAVWITGASSGIGAGLAVALSRKNCMLLLSARNSEALETVKQQCERPQNITILPMDLGNFDAIPNIVDQAIAHLGTIDILVANAGISQRSLIADTDFSVFKKLIDINYLGNVALAKSLLQHFIVARQGHFVVVSSLMGKFGTPYRSGYCGAKHALHGFFDVLRMEHAKDGVDVTIVCPGFVRTEVAKNALTGDGSPQGDQDAATAAGLPIPVFVRKMIRAIVRKRFEVYIGRHEVMGVYLKRFFPRLVHRTVLNSTVR